MNKWMTFQLLAAGQETSFLREWWEGLYSFLRTERRSGAYWALAFAALLCLAGCRFAGQGARADEGKRREQNSKKGCGEAFWRVPEACLIWLFLLMNPLTVWLFEKITGVSYQFACAALAVPILPVTACAAAQIWERCRGRMVRSDGTWEEDSGKAGQSARARRMQKYRPLCVALFLAAALALAGTVYPFDEKGGTVRRFEQWNEADAGAMRAILDEAQRLKEDGQIPLLAAPKRFMENVRRRDADILLAYGRNLWQTDALVSVNDRYGEEQILLCQAMEAEPFRAAETAELALACGCNLIALKEPLSTVFSDNWNLSCVYESESVYVYVR